MMVQEAATSAMAAGRVAQVRERLRARAWVFDDPRSYAAGVDEALQAIAELSSSSGRSPVPAPPAVPPHGRTRREVSHSDAGEGRAPEFIA